MRARRVCWPISAGIIIVVAAALTGCDSPETPGSRAEATCQKVASAGTELIASYPSTVAQIRGWKVGPNTKPAEAAWSKQPEGFAAWCWFDQSSKKQRTVVAALPSGSHVTLVQGDETGLQPSPDGPIVP